QSIEIQVAAAIQIAASRHGYRCTERVEVTEREHIRTGLRHVIRITSLERRVLGVRQLRVRAVGFVAGRDYNTLDALRAQSRGFQHVPGATDIRLERREWRTRRRSHDRLGSKVEDAVHFVFIERTHQEMEVLQLATHHTGAREQARLNESASRYPIAHQN